jgi:short chain dehydrogenase
MSRRQGTSVPSPQEHGGQGQQPIRRCRKPLASCCPGDERRPNEARRRRSPLWVRYGMIPNASLELRPLDLASLAWVGEAAARILTDHPRIDVLLDNAGVMGIPERRTEHGFEMQLAVNHLGHFAFTAQLLPALLRSTDARVVSVTSTGRHTGRALDPDDPTSAGATIPGGHTGSQSSPTCTSRSSSIGGSARRGYRPEASSCTRGSPTPTCRSGACARPAAAGASGSSTLPSDGSGCRQPKCPQLLRAATDPSAIGGALYTPRWVN